MLVEKNWITTNIRERLIDKSCDFKVEMKPYETERFSFRRSCDKTAKIINKKYHKIFLSLSGGLDSAYIFKILVENNIKFQPIIVSVIDNHNNQEEIKRAFKLCKEHNIVPEVIEITEIQYLKIYFKEIYTKLNGIGVFSVPILIAGQIASDQGGVLITGAHILQDNFKKDIVLGINEYATYVDIINPNVLIPFFLYSVGTVYAILKNISEVPINIVKLKQQLYDTKEDEIVNLFSPKTQSLFMKMRIKNPPKYRWYLRSILT